MLPNAMLPDRTLKLDTHATHCAAVNRVRHCHHPTPSFSLRHGILQDLFVKRDFWDFFAKTLRGEQLISSIEKKRKLKSTGRGRCLIRAWLNNGSMLASIARSYSNDAHVKKLYAETAIMRVPELKEEVLRIIEIIGRCKFKLNLELESSIDSAWWVH